MIEFKADGESKAEDLGIQLILNKDNNEYAVKIYDNVVFCGEWDVLKEVFKRALEIWR